MYHSGPAWILCITEFGPTLRLRRRGRSRQQGPGEPVLADLPGAVLAGTVREQAGSPAAALGAPAMPGAPG